MRIVLEINDPHYVVKRIGFDIKDIGDVETYCQEHNWQLHDIMRIHLNTRKSNIILYDHESINGKIETWEEFSQVALQKLGAFMLRLIKIGLQ